MTTIERILEELKQLEKKKTTGSSASLTIHDFITICETVKYAEECERQASIYDI